MAAKVASLLHKFHHQHADRYEDCVLTFHRKAGQSLQTDGLMLTLTKYSKGMSIPD